MKSHRHQRRLEGGVHLCAACGKDGLFHPLSLALNKSRPGARNLHLVKEFNCESWTDVLARTYSVSDFWGRGLSLASGIKLANPDATVILATQASYFFMESGGGLFEAASKNRNITCVILDSQWKLQQRAEREEMGEWNSGGISLNPVALLLLFGATFVAQAHSARVEEAAAIIDLAIRHTGFSAVYVATSPLPQDGSNLAAAPFQRMESVGEAHPFQDQGAALALATRGDRIFRTGVFYQVDRPTPEEKAEAAETASSITDWERWMGLFKP